MNQDKRLMREKRMKKRYENIDRFRERCFRGDFDKDIDEFIIQPPEVTRVRTFMDLTNSDLARCLAMGNTAMVRFEKGEEILGLQRVRIENWTREMKATYNI